MKKAFFLFVFVFIVAGSVYAQDDKTQMEKERQEIQQELADLHKSYNQIKGQRSATLGQLTVLKRKIQVQERYLNNINREIRYLNDDIYNSTLEIIKMRKQLDTLKAQYSRSVVYAYKNRSNYDFLNFIFSAANFNDALKRIAYLKSYRSYREQQVNSIIETQQQIEKRKQTQIGQMNEKKLAIQNQAKQVEVLQSQKKEKDEAVNEMRSKEKELKKQIASKQKRDRDLKSAILAIVRREAKKAEEEAKAKAKAKETVTTTDVGAANANTRTTTAPAAKPRSYLDFNAEDVKLNASFESNRGKLPWPVDNGVVSIHFGPYEVEGTKLRGDNPGITVSTPSAGMAVKSVFNGEVAGVYNMGDGMAVTIRHGKYFTAYSNLSSIAVSKGQEVKAGKILGKAVSSLSGEGQIIFMVQNDKGDSFDPERWLKAR